MNTWVALVVVASLVSGCAAQAHQINYGDGTSEPECDDGDASVVADHVAGDAALGIAHHVARHSHSAKTSAAAAVVGIFAFIASEAAAAEDAKAIDRCRAAKEDWYAAQDAAARARPPEAGMLKPAPRGFYCARSASRDDVSLCTRDHVACDEASDELRVGMPDLGACERAEIAWCAVGHCYANQASCERRQLPDTVGACEQLP